MSTVGKAAGRYAVELMIALFGVLAALAEATLGSDTSTALLIAVTAFLLALSTAALRQEIRASSQHQRMIDAVPPEWRPDAQLEMDRLVHQLTSWISGVRRVPHESSMKVQIEALRKCSSSVEAIHVAVDPDALEMLRDPARGFNEMTRAYESIPASASKRRILVLDRSVVDLSGRGLSDALTLEACARQEAIGFDLRVCLRSSADRQIGDLLVVDELISFSIERRGRGSFSDLEVCINPATVEAHHRLFEDLWTSSVPLADCMPQIPAETDD